MIRVARSLWPTGIRPRRKYRGANLAILAGVSVMIVAFMGIAIYTGLQAYIENEIQKAATTAAMAGAASYYSGVDPNTGRPLPEGAHAKQIAEQTFDSIVNNSGALKGFGISRTSVTTDDASDSVTVNAEGSLPTGFLAPIGINSIKITTGGTARALKYDVTAMVGPITMVPDGSNASMQRTVNLAFPLVDNEGTDIYIEQSAQVEYTVEACNDVECYDLMPGATAVGSGKVKTSAVDPGVQVALGTITIDLEKAKVNKATKLRFTHGNVFRTNYAGGQSILQTQPTPLTLDRVFIFGYAGTCPDAGRCPIPAGFSPVE